MPSTPLNLAASDGAYTDKVCVAWSDSSSATSYEVYRSDTEVGVKTLKGSPVDTIFDDETAVTSTVYYYWVKAVNSAGSSDYSSYNTGWRAPAGLSWPIDLPSPQKNIVINPGNTRIERKLQSGRTEFRRFGSGKPDQAKILFRLTWAQWETFRDFYEKDLNLGMNWFSADWLIALGYSNYKAKILGYPREVANQGYFVDIACIVLIQKTSWIIGADSTWPCATTGGS